MHFMVLPWVVRDKFKTFKDGGVDHLKIYAANYRPWKFFTILRQRRP